MPCIQAKVSNSLTGAQKETLKTRLGEAISILPGKSENWLMVFIEDDCAIWFQGKNDQPIAYVEVKIFGKSSESAYERLTGEITTILEETAGISPEHIYVKYEEVEHWGWNGSNF